MKRLTAPRSWRIKRKSYKYIAKPNPGPHKTEMCMPLSVVLRDVLCVAKNTKEAKHLLHNGKVLVDGKVRKDVKFPVGLMDVLSIPSIEKYYIMLFDNKGYLVLKEISKKESLVKLCKITGKSVIKGGKVQLNLNNGYNIIVKKDKYKPKESLLIEIPSKNIKDHFKLEKGAYIFLTRGRHKGDYGVIEKIEDSMISYKSKDNDVYTTTKKNVFVIGNKKPSISMLK